MPPSIETLRAARRAGGRDPGPAPAAALGGRGGEELAAAAGRGPRRSLRGARLGRPHAPRPHGALVAGHGRLERASPCRRRISQGRSAARAAGRARLPAEAVPQLPCARRRGRPARSGARRRRDAPDAGPAHPPGAAGRRQHARLRHEPVARGDDGARDVPRDAPSLQRAAGARRVAGRRPPRSRIAAMSPVARAALASWSVPPWATAVSAACRVRLRCAAGAGSRVCGRRIFRAGGWPAFSAASPSSGLAIASPLDAFGGLLLSVHMVQHLLLMAVAPPLLLARRSAASAAEGLAARRSSAEAIAPFLAWPAARAARPRPDASGRRARRS